MLKSKPKFRVPTLAEAGTDTADLLAKRSELQAKAATIETERVRLWGVANTGRPTTIGDDDVAELLGEKRDDDNPSRTHARTRLTEIARESQAVSKALAIIDERLKAAKAKASAAIREEVRPEYAARVQALAKALSAAHDARLAYRELTDEMDRRDVLWSPLERLDPHVLMGDPLDQSGPLARWFHDARAAGYITTRDIPEGFR